MAKKRKLQVFVSSTFTDLKEERQAAVEAILTTGHIPAGMELFAGKNEEQMNIIKEWIDESDIYMLLLGGRYGSVESVSSKSYTHLEYEHAQSIGKPVFVVVASDNYINQKVLANGGNPEGIHELEYRAEYKIFRKDITGRYVKFWDNKDQLQLVITNTLHALERDESLIGWVPGSEVTNSGPIAEQFAMLTKENANLRSLVNQSSKENATYNSLTFDEMYRLLTLEEIKLEKLDVFYRRLFEVTAEEFGDLFPSFIHVFVVWTIYSPEGEYQSKEDPYLEYILKQLVDAGLVIPLFLDVYGGISAIGEYAITETGKKYLLKLKISRNVEKIRQMVEELKVQTGNDFFYPLVE